MACDNATHLVLKNVYHRSALSRAFHGFGQAKFPDDGSVLSSSQFSVLPLMPPKILIDPKVVKINSKIIISLR